MSDTRKYGHGAGDGPICPENNEHGKLYHTAKGHLWCAVSQSLFATSDSGHGIGDLIRSGDHIEAYRPAAPLAEGVQPHG